VGMSTSTVIGKPKKEIKKTLNNDNIRREFCLAFICCERSLFRSSAFSSSIRRSWFSCDVKQHGKMLKYAQYVLVVSKETPAIKTSIKEPAQRLHHVAAEVAAASLHLWYGQGAEEMLKFSSD